MFVGTSREARNPEGYRQQVVSNTAAALADVPPAATFAIIQVEAQGIRSRDDGTVPTAAIGMPWAALSIITLNSRREIKRFRAIRSGGSDATLNISFYSADKKAYKND